MGRKGFFPKQKDIRYNEQYKRNHRKKPYTIVHVEWVFLTTFPGLLQMDFVKNNLKDIWKNADSSVGYLSLEKGLFSLKVAKRQGLRWGLD